MFNRYWRTYPWGLQLALAFLMVFTFMSFSAFLTIVLVPTLTGVALKDLVELTGLSAPKAVRASLLAQAISQIGTFLAPAVIFAALTHPRLREYLGLRPPGKTIHWLLVTGIMVGLIPVILYGEAWLVQHVHLGQKADLIQKKTDNVFKAFLNLRSGGDLFLLLGVLAFLPAIAEELIFRGVFLRLFHRGFNRRADPGSTALPDIQRSMLLPVVISALMFAYWHNSPYGFVFIFFAGCVLALIYQLTGSLICCMWAHFLYNGLQVATVYLSQHSPTAKQIAEGDNLPIVFPIVGLALFAGSFYALVRQQTPLKPDWSSDFREGEEAM